VASRSLEPLYRGTVRAQSHRAQNWLLWVYKFWTRVALLAWLAARAAGSPPSDRPAPLAPNVFAPAQPRLLTAPQPRPATPASTRHTRPIRLGALMA